MPETAESAVLGLDAQSYPQGAVVDVALDNAGTEPGPEPVDELPLSVLAKTNLILSAFTYGTNTLGLTELSRRSGVSKASVHRLSRELVELGYLARSRKGYQLGWRMFELGQLVPGPASLRDVARPALQDLRMTTRAVVHLAVPQGPECVYLERIAGRRELAVIGAVGDRVPNYTTASGLLFLAHSTPQAIACLSREALTGLGVQHPSELELRFAEIRDRRYAEEKSTCLPGFKAISVPVKYSATDHVIASVSVAVPLHRKDDRQLLRALWATAADISRGLLHRTSRTRVPAGTTAPVHLVV